MSECGFCKVEMESYESNNPYPFFKDSDERVCRDCNNFVTAARLCLTGESVEAVQMFLGLAFSLKQVQEQAFSQFMKGVNEDE